MSSPTRPIDVVAVAILAAATTSSALSFVAPIAILVTVACLIAAVIVLRRARTRLARTLLWCAIAVSVVSVIIGALATLAIGGASTA